MRQDTRRTELLAELESATRRLPMDALSCPEIEALLLASYRILDRLNNAPANGRARLSVVGSTVQP